MDQEQTQPAPQANPPSYNAEYETIARVCHEANKALCEAFGDTSQVPWQQAPEWQRRSAVNGVMFNLEHPGAPPSASHESWLEEKRAAGWQYGPVKDVERKVHPCFCPYDALPPEQRAKDHVFRAIVHALAATKPAPF